MADVISRNDPGYADYVIALATGGSLKDGLINEPRIYFDVIPQNSSSSVITGGTPGVFVNGEQWPVRITHLLAAQAGPYGEGSEFNIQRIALRLIMHDVFYMNATPVPLPLWGNKVVAGPDPISAGLSSWNLVNNGRPFVLPPRSTLIVRVQLTDTTDPESAVPVTVTITGIGALSKRPYFFNGSVNLETVQRTNLNTVDFRNDGLEPVVITDITAVVSGEVQDSDPLGDISRLSLNIMQVGGGTGAWWFSGPQTPVPVPNMPATLLGATSGRAVVHELPGDGLLLNPGDGFSVDTQATVDNQGELVLVFGAAGYIMVT